MMYQQCAGLKPLTLWLPDQHTNHYTIPSLLKKNEKNPRYFMLDYGIKCTSAFTNIFRYLSKNRAHNYKKWYLLLSGNGNPLINQEQVGALAQIQLSPCLLHSGPQNWQMFISYLIAHEYITITSDAQILFNDLCMRPL